MHFAPRGYIIYKESRAVTWNTQKKRRLPSGFVLLRCRAGGGREGGENKSNAPWKAKPMGMEMVTCALGGPSAPDPPSGTTQQRTWGEGESYAPRWCLTPPVPLPMSAISCIRSLCRKEYLSRIKKKKKKSSKKTTNRFALLKLATLSK